MAQNSFELMRRLMEDAFPIVRMIVVLIVVFTVFNIILKTLKKNFLKRARTKKQISNVDIFFNLTKYVFFLVLVIIAIFSYSGSWTGLGLSIGLLSAAMGWALQKPITGIAAWIMVIVKRPFEIGDRIIIGNVKGDVADITLTHIYINEIGGIVPSEENSGRMIMVPNSVLFEQNITNYTLQSEYILDQVIVTVTYESDLDKAIEIALNAANKHTRPFIKKVSKRPFVRTYFQPNGINVHVRYFSQANKLAEYSSKITMEIFRQITKTKKVEIAYPHTEVILRKK